ncbi:hypothetical protein [Microbaculum sp. FT89]|uniref:hypothetical protein n=1 Tax=Microbaculum sp. FT89 TaxID=3447298 RepID=UPI003F537DEE
MNRIVKKHYPASKLPEDLREGLPEGAVVDIEITVDESAVARRRTLRDYFGAAKDRETSTEEAVRRIRELRDEWD